MRLPENILKIARMIRYNCTSLTGMNLAGMKWAMQTETATWTRRMVSIWMVRGEKRPGTLSEAGSNFGSAAKDNDIVLGLIGDLPMK